MLNIFDWLRARSVDGRTATKLYGSIVAQARQPVFYECFAVQDVAEKRYEMIVLHIVIVLERLRAQGDRGMEIAKMVVEAFVRDLDGSIREMALGDTKVPANVKKAAGGLYDRDALYRQAFEGGDVADRLDQMTLGDLLGELVFGGEQCIGVDALLCYTVAARDALRTWQLDGGQSEKGSSMLPFPEPQLFIEELA